MHGHKRKFLILVLVSLSVVVLSSTIYAQSQERSAFSDRPISGTLTDEESDIRYSFTATAGDRVSVTLTSREFDTLVRIETDDGNPVDSNDDFGGSLNSTLENVTIPYDGDFDVVVTSSDGSGRGDFVLVVGYTPIQTIEYGDVVIGAINENTPEVVYRFEGEKGDKLAIGMSSTAIDSLVVLSNESNELISDDEGAGASNALILGYTLPKSGMYFIKAQTYTWMPEGEFSLSLQKIEPTMLEFGVTATATMDGAPVFFTFEGEAGTLFAARVRSEGGEMDTFMNIRTTEGYYLVYDDDSGYGYDPEVQNIMLSENGIYTMAILPASVDTKGEFEIEVLEIPAKTFECDSSQTLVFDTKNFQAPYVMDVKANDVVNMVFVPTDGNVATLNINVTLNGEYFAYYYADSTMPQLGAEIEVPFSGELLFTITDYLYRRHEFNVNITCS